MIYDVFMCENLFWTYNGVGRLSAGRGVNEVEQNSKKS